MNTFKIVGIGLIIAGGLALAYGGFTYTKDSHETNVGPLKISVEDKERVNIPVWAGVAALALGAGLLVFGGKRS